MDDKLPANTIDLDPFAYKDQYHALELLISDHIAMKLTFRRLLWLLGSVVQDGPFPPATKPVMKLAITSAIQMIREALDQSPIKEK